MMDTTSYLKYKIIQWTCKSF